MFAFSGIVWDEMNVSFALSIVMSLTPPFLRLRSAVSTVGVALVFSVIVSDVAVNVGNGDGTVLSSVGVVA